MEFVDGYLESAIEGKEIEIGNLNTGQMLLPLSHGALAVDYNICTS